MTRLTQRHTAETLQILCNEAVELGRFYSLAARAQPYRNGTAGRPQQVLESIFQSSWRSLLIGLAGMLSTDQESITLSYLLDLAENHPYDFKHATPDTVKNQTSAARDRLAEFTVLEQRLRIIRDRRLAHLDRKLINEPEVVNDFVVSLDQCREILRSIEKIIEDLYAAFYGKHKDFDALKAAFTEGLEAIFKQHKGWVDEE